MIQIFIGIGISIFLIIITGSIHRNQNKDTSIYNKVTKLIENENVRKMINILTVATVVIMDVLLISIVLSIFLPSVEWGWIDRNTLITTIATIMGGFFGFIGASIGVIGTYGAFYLGVKKEQEKEKENKKSVKEFELEILQKLLEYTLEETNVLATAIVDEYVDFYEREGIIEVLHMRVKESNLIFNYMLEEIVTKDNVTSIKDRAIRYLESKGDKNISNNDLYKNVEKINEFKLYELHDEIKNIFIENYNFRDLVYTDEWYKYMIHLKDNESYTFTDRKDIINWINYLNSDSIESINQRIQKLEEKYEYLSREGEAIEAKFIEQTVDDLSIVHMRKIMQFIEYRDNIIDILDRVFDNYEIEYNLLASDDYIINEKLKN